MDPPTVRKPRARPPPPTRKQSLPSLVSGMDEAEDTFDENLGASHQQQTGDGHAATGMRRTRSELHGGSAAADIGARQAPVSHQQHGGTKVLPTLTGDSALAPLRSSLRSTKSGQQATPANTGTGEDRATSGRLIVYYTIN